MLDFPSRCRLAPEFRPTGDRNSVLVSFKAITSLVILLTAMEIVASSYSLPWLGLSLAAAAENPHNDPNKSAAQLGNCGKCHGRVGGRAQARQKQPPRSSSGKKQPAGSKKNVVPATRRAPPPLVTTKQNVPALPSLITSKSSPTASSPIRLTVRNQAKVRMDNVPLTFGQVFIPGAVKSGNSLSAKIIERNQALPIQVDRKAKHREGSLRHAIISAVVPSLDAGEKVTLELTPASANKPMKTLQVSGLLESGYDAEVKLQMQEGTFTASSKKLLQAGNPDLWLAGDQATEWIASGPFVDGNGRAHPHLTARFNIRAYSRNGRIIDVRTGVIVENNWTYVPEAGNRNYDVSISINGKAVYSKQNLVHYHHARWHKVFWLNGGAQIHIAHDPAYLMASGAVPNYDPNLVGNVDQGYIQKRFGRFNPKPMGLGLATKSMADTGAHDDIGLLPRWAALYLLSQDGPSKRATLGMGDLGGSWSVHYRDKRTALPASIDDYPAICTVASCSNIGDSKNPKTGKIERVSGCVKRCRSPFAQDSAHQPSFAYLPYLVTGDHYYLEELQFWAAYNLIAWFPAYRSFDQGLIYRTQERGQAWMMRTMAHAAFITPDMHPLKHYFEEKLRHNIDWYTERYTTNRVNSYGALRPYYSFPTASPWMDDFFTAAMGVLVELGYETAIPIRNWKAKFPVQRMGFATPNPGDFCWNFASSYRLLVAPATASGGPMFKTIKEAYDATNGKSVPHGGHVFNDGGHLCASSELASFVRNLAGPTDMIGYSASPSGFPSNLQPALAIAVDSGIAGAAEAWNLFDSRMRKPDYRGYPNWAIVPRNRGVQRSSVRAKTRIASPEQANGPVLKPGVKAIAEPVATVPNANLSADLAALAELQPGQWYEIQNSRMSRVDPCPARNCKYSGVGGQKMVMKAWSGAAYDWIHDKFVIHGGGHRDYAGNEVYAFDVNKLQWERLSNPSTEIVRNALWWSDGTPNSSHTYDNLEYVPDIDAVCVFGNGSRWSNGYQGLSTACFDMSRYTWKRKGNVPKGAMGGKSAYDPVSKSVWRHGAGQGSSLERYDAHNDAWQNYGNRKAGSWISYRTTAEIDPVRRFFITVGAKEVRVWNIRSNLAIGVSQPTSGDRSIVNKSNPGLLYDPKIDKIVAWAGGADIFSLDTESWIWEKMPLHANNRVIPGAGNTNGTFGRFRYVPSKDLYIAVSATDQNVYFFKPRR